jgi:hypothetical protein
VHEVAERRGQISDIEAKAQGEHTHRKALESDKTIRRDLIMIMRRIVQLEEMQQPKTNGRRSLPAPMVATKKRPTRKKKKPE